MEIADPEQRKALTTSLVGLLGNILTQQAGTASLSTDGSSGEEDSTTEDGGGGEWGKGLSVEKGRSALFIGLKKIPVDV